MFINCYAFVQFTSRIGSGGCIDAPVARYIGNCPDPYTVGYCIEIVFGFYGTAVVFCRPAIRSYPTAARGKGFLYAVKGDTSKLVWL